MGVTTSDNDEQASAGEMAAAKPKERQFQVVPVPGTFTRGRWKCWDYKDKTSETDEIIDFTDKSEKPPATVYVTENAAAYIASGGTPSEAMKNTLSEPLFMQPVDSTAAVSQPIDVPNAERESSTIVVTSIAPPSVTPIHGTPSSPNISPVTNHGDTVREAKRGISVMGAGEQVPFREKTPTTLPPTVSAPVLSKIPATVATNTTEVAPPGGNTGQIYVTSSATAPVLQPLQEIADPNLTGQQPSLLSSFASEPAVANMPISVNENEDPTATSASAPGPNVVAIDNKIEQAMDLVKTHLTFAVREEVEILRSTIVELEAKVAQLESQNQVLKQFAPIEVVNSLAVLVQQHQQKQMQQQQQQLPSGATTPIPGQNVPLPATTQGIQQQQSMPALPTETLAAQPTLGSVSASAGLIVEVEQPVTEKQQQQQSVTHPAVIGEAGKEQQ